MKVNERRTVVGGWLATVCPPNRGERSTRMPLENQSKSAVELQNW